MTDNPIRLARIHAGLSQAQLAERLGVAQSAVSQWETGKVMPELETRIRLAGVLRMPLHELLPITPPAPRIQRTAQRYASLPLAEQEVIDQLVELFWRRHRQ